jgi:hypothetical protein
VPLTLQSEPERVAAIVKDIAMSAALGSHSVPGLSGAEVWSHRVARWRERGVLDRSYLRRPRQSVPEKRRKKLDDVQRAKLPPKVESGQQLVELGEAVWQDKAMLAKAVEMWDAGMSAGAVRQAQCMRIGWVKKCKANCRQPLWHRVFRCGLRFCPLCMSSVYESLFHEAVERLESVASRLIPEWPVVGHQPLRVIAKIDFTIRNTGEMPSAEKVRWFNRKIRQFFVRLARRKRWQKGEWGAAWCAEFGPGNTNLHAHAVFCGPWIEQRGREASAHWSEVVGEYALVSVKAAKSFSHALRHAIKYPAASWKYFTASSERLASLEKAFYTVKRFHCVGAFYNPPRDVKTPPTILSPYDKCPSCGSRLEELPDAHWFSLHEIMRIGSQDLGAWERNQRLLGRDPRERESPS